MSKASLSKAILFVVTLLCVPPIPRKLVFMKDFPQRGRAAKRPAPFGPKAASFMEAGFRHIWGI